MTTPSTTSTGRSIWAGFLSAGALGLFILAYFLAQGTTGTESPFPFDYGTPYGTVYTVPRPRETTAATEGTTGAIGGWTVATVRDIFPDRYSFTAYVPVLPEDPEQSDANAERRPLQQIRILDEDTPASTLVRDQVGVRFSPVPQGDVTFLIKRPTDDERQNTADRVNVPLDLSVVRGSVLFIRFECIISGAPALQAKPGEASKETLQKQAHDRCLTLSAKAQREGQVPEGTVRYYVREMGVVAAQPTLAQRLGVMILVAAGFFFLSLAIFIHKKYGGLKYLIVGKDNRYSNSQFQTVIWFFVLLIALTTTQLFRVAQGGLSLVGWIGIPSSLLALSGLSALTFVGAALITDQNIKNGQMVKPQATAPTFPHDLFHDDRGKFDLGDFQSAFISVLASLAYLVILLGYLGSLSLKRDALPDVESTILTIFGIAQGTYLVKKGLKVSDQKDVAFSVTPTTVKYTAGSGNFLTLSVEWTKDYDNQVLQLEALENTAPYPHLTFPAVTVVLNDPTRRKEIRIPFDNPGKGIRNNVVIRGVVNDLVRTADITVEGT